MKRKTETITVSVPEMGQDVGRETLKSLGLNVDGMVKLIDSEIKTSLSVLVEYPNGERKWVTSPYWERAAKVEQ